jgi:hypothetical protein
MSKTEIKEKLIEIGSRVPPGDQWKMSNVNAIQEPKPKQYSIYGDYEY